ncbi:leucine--tRNA ligase [Pinibacter soli]|uniref:Leucine--tRNA ligase n=1 Tax=Pinibacter soli TaxID=3044211 RepID=A0ABT6RIS2_9BACT|nr:leucine--tRNA ligase [Pinibacter soli]MDI3322465.1 leucine--tRNA ligase [Pinibacter soli]
MEYDFRRIEKDWQKKWIDAKVYKVSNDTTKPKYYVLDMFPYPSGAGLHVGHPLGYIASDIFSRYKRLKGYNVLHPMGYDAFGLPAEQYAIEHGIHPAVSTDQNIKNFRSQLDNIGFCYDWDREVKTSDPNYYKWTQWIFLQLFKSWYNRKTQKAESIDGLIKVFETEGNGNHVCPGDKTISFSAEEWKSFDEKRREDILMEYRLSFCGYGEVNWCEALGTVLANDEVVNGVSERGGYPVVKKKLRQWYLRITEYADRLLTGLDKIEFSEAMKEMQTNWIGKSYGAEIKFDISASSESLVVYTTRPDTIFGVDFMVIAPEHDLIEKITSADQKQAVEEYVTYVKSRSDRERQAEKKITGAFTGAYAVNPFNGKQIPIWISEYVLIGYGTGAIMAVPCGDERDFKFAQHFNIPITNIIGSHFDGLEANATKDALLENSDFLNGVKMRDAMDVVITKLEEMGIGKRQTNYRMRDAAFSRQRYWGEPFPIVWKDGIAHPLPESELPVLLPEMDKIKNGPEGEGPLANLTEWKSYNGGIREVNTMPGYAGSSWYFLRYMDPENNQEFCSRKASDYWGQVDLYIGGTEHAVGHLLYSRMWTKVLFDLGLIGHEEPYKKLVNQGMIQGSSRFVYRVHGTSKFVSHGLKEQYSVDAIHVDVNFVDGLELDTEAFKEWKNGEFGDAEFILEGDKYICGVEVEKMSKSKFNTVNPDYLVDKYGADTFRMYEMFLGPVEMSKPWDTKGIEGVHRFLRKFWRLFADEDKGLIVTNDTPTDAEWKVLYKAAKKIEEDTEKFSFNTAVSTFMIAVNELGDLKCHKKAILEKLLIALTPYAPHIAEELWHMIGNEGYILDAAYPPIENKYLVETAKAYPVAINGKTRTELTIALDATQQQVEEMVMADDIVKKWLEGKAPKKVIYVKNKMINVVM